MFIVQLCYETAFFGYGYLQIGPIRRALLSPDNLNLDIKRLDAHPREYRLELPRFSVEDNLKYIVKSFKATNDDNQNKNMYSFGILPSKFSFLTRF